MVNLAVIEIRDVVKYLVRITIVVTVVITLTRYFSSFRTKMQVREEAKQYTFLSCLDVTIPSIKDMNKQEQKGTNNQSNIGPLKMALEIELGMMDSLKTSEKEEEKTTQENRNENVTEEDSKIEGAKTGVTTQVQESNVPQKFTNTYNGVKIKNETKIKLTQEMLTPNVKLNMKNVLIYHTHTCESYTQSEKYTYKASGNFRTIDKGRSVVKVGTELGKYMKNYGYNVIHDTTYYDYPSYNGSYERSLSNVGKLLEKNKGTEILFDIHRDAIRR